MRQGVKMAVYSAILLSVFGACSKMNDLHQKYLDTGEKVYLGQPDSAKVLSGNNRIKIRYWLSDPRAKKMIVYWNIRKDSLLLDLPPVVRGQARDILIENLPEKQYEFELVTMNEQLANRSISLKVSGQSYGANFESGLLGRQIKYATLELENTVSLEWYGPSENGYVTEVTYTDQQDKKVTIRTPMNESTTILPEYKEELTFRTLFLPNPTAIDTFYSITANYTRIDIPVNKTTFVRWNPPGIPYGDAGANFSIEKIWDNTTTSFFIQTGSTLPHSFTFDTGKVSKLNRVRQWQRLTENVVYRVQNLQRFEIWGTASSNVTADFSGWTRLGVFESRKPSGLAVGSETAEDLAFAANGEDFMIDPSAPPVRYIRYVVYNTWDSKPVVAVSEVNFFEID